MWQLRVIVGLCLGSQHLLQTFPGKVRMFFQHGSVLCIVCYVKYVLWTSGLTLAVGNWLKYHLFSLVLKQRQSTARSLGFRVFMYPYKKVTCWRTNHKNKQGKPNCGGLKVRFAWARLEKLKRGLKDKNPEYLISGCFQFLLKSEHRYNRENPKNHQRLLLGTDIQDKNKLIGEVEFYWTGT